MFLVYPTVVREDDCFDYRVKVNGVAVPLNTARVSADPLNRRWPGHQRPIDQTETVNFLSGCGEGTLSFEIEAPEPFERVTVRPLERRIVPETDGKTIRFSAQAPCFLTVEPYGRKRALTLLIDPPFDYGVRPTDETVLYFGPGETEAGTIRLLSNQTLYLAEGAVVYASVEADGAENIRILGRGILDNSHAKERILFDCHEDGNDKDVCNAERKHAVSLRDCRNVVIDGITVRDSLCYTICPYGCDEIRISDVKIIGNWRYNSDGINCVNCTDVSVDFCFVRTFDDCVCVKGFAKEETPDFTARHPNVSDLSVRRCVLWNDWGKCLEIGAETVAKEIRNVVFEECAVLHVTGTPLDCYNVNNADVHDIVWRNISVEFDDIVPPSVYQKTEDQIYVNDNPDFAPLLCKATVEYHFEYSALAGSRIGRGKNRRLTFENIRYYGRHPVRMRFAGFDETAKTSDVTVRNLFINGRPVDASDVAVESVNYCENIRVLQGEES